MTGRIRFLGGRFATNLGVPHAVSPNTVCHPQIIYSTNIVFPDGPTNGAVCIDRSGNISSTHPNIPFSKAKQIATQDNLDLIDLGDGIALSPGLIDVHCHISELGRNWEGYRTATRAAAAGGITTLMGMPLNSIPATTTIEALRQELHAAKNAPLLADVGLWGGAVPSNTTDIDGLESLGKLLDAGVFGLKAFLAPLPPDAGYETVSPIQLKAAANICGNRKKPLLVHSELMTQKEQDSRTQVAYADKSEKSYEAHVASRPAKWEQDAVQVVCDLSDDCHMHVVHLSDSGCLDIISLAKQRLAEQTHNEIIGNGNLTVETCPHYLLFDSDSLPDGDTRYKCFPPIRSKTNQVELWRRGLFGSENRPFSLIDMIASDHSPCSPELRMQDTGSVRKAWGGLSGLQWQLPSTAMALHRFLTDSDADGKKNDIKTVLSILARWWSTAPSLLVPGLSGIKGAIKVGHRADLCAWDPSYIGRPIDYCIEHHRWTNGGAFADMELKGRVLGTWLRGVKVYDGETDKFLEEESSDGKGAGSMMLHC